MSVAQRSDDSDSEPQTRAYLLGQERAFCSLMVRTLLEDGKESGRYAFDALSPRVNALADGDEVRSIHGWELPPGHWARALGLQSDWTLGADDVLREEISRAPSRPPRSGYENTPLI